MVRQVQIHMQQTQGQNFFFTLVNVAKAKNRFLLAGRKAAPITMCGPILLQHDEDPLKPIRWAVVDPPKVHGFCSMVGAVTKTHHHELSHLTSSHPRFNPFTPCNHDSDVDNLFNPVPLAV